MDEGDKNTRFFHNYLKEMNRRNDINVVEWKDGIEEGVDEIKGIVKPHFEEFFIEGNENGSVLEGLDLK